MNQVELLTRLIEMKRRLILRSFVSLIKKNPEPYITALTVASHFLRVIVASQSAYF